MPTSRSPYPTSCSTPRICLACHGGRLATLLETATAFRLYRFETESVVADGFWPMPAGGLAPLALRLAEAGVALLVCGAATCCCLTPFTGQGVAVVPWIVGDVPTVLSALAQNRLETLLAPGARPARSLGRLCRVWQTLSGRSMHHE